MHSLPEALQQSCRPKSLPAGQPQGPAFAASRKLNLLATTPFTYGTASPYNQPLYVSYPFDYGTYALTTPTTVLNRSTPDYYI